MDIRIEVMEDIRGSGEIIGFVGDRDVIGIGYWDGRWCVNMSSCLPTRFELASAYVECFRQAFEKANEIQAADKS